MRATALQLQLLGPETVFKEKLDLEFFCRKYLHFQILATCSLFLTLHGPSLCGGQVQEASCDFISDSFVGQQSRQVKLLCTLATNHIVVGLSLESSGCISKSSWQ